MNACRARRAGFVVFASVVAASLGGCVGVGAPPAPTVSPPALSFDDGSRPDFARDMQGCLQDLGWPVELGVDNSIRVSNLPEAQGAEYQEDLADCQKEFGYDQPPPQLSDAQLRQLYPHVLWASKCLADAGYSIEQPPSEQAFIDFYNNNGGTWSPYSQFTASMDDDDLTTLLAACPRSG